MLSNDHAFAKAMKELSKKYEQEKKRKAKLTHDVNKYIHKRNHTQLPQNNCCYYPLTRLKHN